MINITIIAPNGYKIYFKLTKEQVETWGNELITLANFNVGSVKFDFSKEEGEKGSLSEA